MFDPFTLALIGGAAGGLLNKKDPLKGALLGAAGGYGGGLLAGNTLLASQAAAPVAEGALTQVGAQSAAPVVDAAITPVAGESMHPWAAQFQQSATPATGLLQEPAPVADAVINPVSGTRQFMSQAKEIGGVIKPYSDSIGTGVAVANMFKGNPKAPITPSPITTPMPNSALGNMVAMQQQQQAERMALEQQKRLQRRQLRGGVI